MSPHEAPSGSVWEMTWTTGGTTLFVVLDGFTDEGDRRVLWLREGLSNVGNVRSGSHVNTLSKRVT